MQYAVQSCMHGRLQCSSSSFSLFSHHRLSTSPVVAPGVAPCVMLHRRREFIGSCGKGASSNALSNNKGSLSSHFLLRGVAVVKLLPQQYTGGLDRNGRGTTVKASVGAYNKEAFVDDAEAQKLAQVFAMLPIILSVCVQLRPSFRLVLSVVEAGLYRLLQTRCSLDLLCNQR